MKTLKRVLASYALTIGFVFVWSFSSMAVCPTTSCDNDCGSSGSGCQITQYDENGNLCSTTWCNGKRGAIQMQ